MIKTITTLLISWIIVTSILWLNAERITRIMLPLYQQTFALLTKYHQVISIQIDHRTSQPVIKIETITSGQRLVGLYAIPNGQGLSSSTLMGHVLQPMILFYTLIFAWPARNLKDKILLVIIAVPTLTVFLLFDVPVVLLGALDDLIFANYYPRGIHSSIAIHWMNLMNGGGRLALPLISGALSIIIWRYVNTIFLRNRTSLSHSRKI